MAEEEGIILCLACRCACKASTTDREDPALHLCQMFSEIKTAPDAYQSHKPTSSGSFRMDAPKCAKYLPLLCRTFGTKQTVQKLKVT